MLFQKTIQNGEIDPFFSVVLTQIRYIEMSLSRCH